MVRRTRSSRVAIGATALGIGLLAGPVGAAETVVERNGEVPPGGDPFVLIPFEVPAGTVEIQVDHINVDDANVLDWGLIGPDGYRGWGGGNAEPAIVGVDAASRSYSPGAIETGTWNVLIGKAQVGDSPAPYEITITLRDEATLAPQPERAPYQPAAALEDTTRWYAGDFHVHSVESGDARPPLDEIGTFAASRGLDFVVLSDHNVHTSLDFLADVQPRHPELLFVPGVEFTTYAGHANGIGATRWVDHREPAAQAAEAYHEQGALFAINHPVLSLGSLCIGCAWEQELDFALVDAVEITNGGLEPFGGAFSDQAIAYWDDLCSQGLHVAAIGGSDDHKAGVDLNQFQSPIGDATTLVFAEELSADAIVAGVRSGRTVVKLQGPGDPDLEFSADELGTGDTIEGAASFVAVIRGGQGEQVRTVVNGEAQTPVAVDADPFELRWDATPPASGEDRYRVEVLVGGSRRVVSSHLWVAADGSTAESTSSGGGTGSGDTVGDETSGPGAATETDPSGPSGGDPGPQTPLDDDGGCNCRSERAPSSGIALIVVLLGFAVRRRRY